MNTLKTQPVTLDEIKLWQESTPADHRDWDPETIADCDAFLTLLIQRLDGATRSNHENLNDRLVNDSFNRIFNECQRPGA